MLSRYGICIAFFCFYVSSWSSSFTMNPWILVFEPEKKAISQVVSFEYQADGERHPTKVEKPAPLDEKNAPVPVEISISAREINLEGVVTYPSSDGADDFVVYPSQFILYPGDIKKVQIQWVGAELPKKEISYGFIATQLPLKFDNNQEPPKKAVAIIEFQRRYEAIIVVRPSNLKPAVVVDTAYCLNDTSGTHMVILLNNKGTGMQNLKSMQFTIAPLDANGKIKFSEKITAWKDGSSNATTQSLMAGFKRKIQIPWPVGLAVQPINVTVSFPITPK
jgi:P pilus assembly chaperone PapD